MVYAELYNKGKTYFFQDNHYATYEALKALFPAINDLAQIVFTDYSGQIIISIEPLNLKRTELEIDPTLTNEDAVLAIVNKLNNPEEEVSDETRIADALEDLVVLNMPDEEVIE